MQEHRPRINRPPIISLALLINTRARSSSNKVRLFLGLFLPPVLKIVPSDTYLIVSKIDTLYGTLGFPIDNAMPRDGAIIFGDLAQKRAEAAPVATMLRSAVRRGPSRSGTYRS